MNFLETAVVTLIAGTVGGAFGPYLTHWLDSLRRRQLRNEERRRENRDMLLTYMQTAMTNRTTLGSILLMAADEDPGFKNRYEAMMMRVWDTHPSFFWRPARIADEKLRELARELEAANGQAMVLLITALNEGVKKPDGWDSSASQSMERLQKAIDAVDGRLNELDW